MNTITPLNPVEPSWRLEDAERDRLGMILERITTSPYRNSSRFLEEVLSVGGEAERFCDRVKELMLASPREEQPIIYLKNLPVEEKLPVFGHDDPVSEKYDVKSTFVTEALLVLFAHAADTPIIGYRTINNGDFFHDIYLKDSLKHTASQKSMVSFGFHYDMGFKKVRPDWANLACLRSSNENYVSTSFVRNLDVMENLAPADLDILAQDIFTTPAEVVSVMGGEDNAPAVPCPVYFADRPWKFEYFEGRTVSTEPEGTEALKRLDEILHRFKRHLVLEKGDLAGISNNHGSHCREVLQVRDMAAHRTRWLIKTYNVNDIEPHLGRFVPGRYRVADE